MIRTLELLMWLARIGMVLLLATSVILNFHFNVPGIVVKILWYSGLVCSGIGMLCIIGIGALCVLGLLFCYCWKGVEYLWNLLKK